MRQSLNISQSITLEQTESISRYFRDIYSYKTLTREEERALFKAYRTEGSTEAREKLIKHNLRFVVSVAKHYQHGLARCFWWI